MTHLIAHQLSTRAAPTLEEEQSLAYLMYETCPHVIHAAKAIAQGVIEQREGHVFFRGANDETEPTAEAAIIIDPNHQYDLVESTLYGLNEALVRAEQGTSLREAFDRELDEFNRHLAHHQNLFSYGMYAYYPGTGELVHYAPEHVHRLALVTSTSRLLQDAELKLSWHEIREVFERTVVAIAGASVGNNIAHALAMDLRPRALKIADPNFYKLSNANRVRLSYRDIVLSNGRRGTAVAPFGLKNKAITAAEQLHAIDPFMQVWAYFEGVNATNVDGFVAGNGVEPRANYIVEETDNPDTKVLIRETARKHRTRLVMATDIGSAVQVDIRPFDLDPQASLAFATSDDELYARQHTAHRRAGDREVFWDFVDSLIGVDYRTRGEFGHLVTGRLPKLCASLPQIGSTATMAGGIVAETIARMALGIRYPERFMIDKRTLEIRRWGAWV